MAINMLRETEGWRCRHCLICEAPDKLCSVAPTLPGPYSLITLLRPFSIATHIKIDSVLQSHATVVGVIHGNYSVLPEVCPISRFLKQKTYDMSSLQGALHTGLLGEVWTMAHMSLQPHPHRLGNRCPSTWRGFRGLCGTLAELCVALESAGLGCMTSSCRRPSKIAETVGLELA